MEDPYAISESGYFAPLYAIYLHQQKWVRHSRLLCAFSVLTQPNEVCSTLMWTPRNVDSSQNNFAPHVKLYFPI